MPTRQPRLALVINDLARAKIQFLADKHGRSTSAEIVTAVESWIEQHEDEMDGFVSEFEPTAAEQAEIDEMLKAAQRRAYQAVMLKRNQSERATKAKVDVTVIAKKKPPTN